MIIQIMKEHRGLEPAFEEKGEEFWVTLCSRK